VNLKVSVGADPRLRSPWGLSAVSVLPDTA
jgi:hypothetical protein